MEGLTVTEVVEATKGTLVGGDPGREMASFSTDRRTLKGKSFDGHTFLSEAAGKGALGCVVAAPPSIPLPPGFVVIQVEETQWALGQVAARSRRRSSALD